VAGGHQLPLKPSTDHLSAWVPMDLVDQEVDAWVEVDIGSGHWARSGPTYRLSRDANGSFSLVSL
jgi:hypothetical protein